MDSSAARLTDTTRRRTCSTKHTGSKGFLWPAALARAAFRETRRVLSLTAAPIPSFDTRVSPSAQLYPSTTAAVPRASTSLEALRSQTSYKPARPQVSDVRITARLCPDLGCSIRGSTPEYDRYRLPAPHRTAARLLRASGASSDFPGAPTAAGSEPPSFHSAALAGGASPASALADLDGDSLGGAAREDRRQVISKQQHAGQEQGQFAGGTTQQQQQQNGDAGQVELANADKIALQHQPDSTQHTQQHARHSRQRSRANRRETQQQQQQDGKRRRATARASSSGDDNSPGAQPQEDSDGQSERKGRGKPPPVRLRAVGGRQRQRQSSLVERIQSCSTLGQLLALYDRMTAEAETAARQRAERAGAAAASTGLSGAAAAMPAAVVWMFLAAAWESVAAWKQGRRGGRRDGGAPVDAQLKLPAGPRQQLAALLSRACGLVLWAERLSPAKACLLLSLMVACGRFPGAEQHLGLLVEDSLNSLDTYRSGEVALAASSFAKLDYFPGKGWLETMLEVSTGQLHNYRPRDLAFLLWSLAKWRAALPTSWLLEFYSAYETCCELAHTPDLNMVCWALGVGISSAGWAVRPPERLANQLMMEIQVRLPVQSSHALAHVALGLCVADIQPPSFWLQEFHETVKATLPTATSGLAFSNLLWACACWQRERHPGEELLVVACKHSVRWLHTLDSRGLAVLLLALSDLEHTPPAEWVGLALETAHRLLPSTNPESAVAVLWAVSRFERQRAMATASTAAAAPAPGKAGAPPGAMAPPLPLRHAHDRFRRESRGDGVGQATRLPPSSFSSSSSSSSSPSWLRLSALEPDEVAAVALNEEMWLRFGLRDEGTPPHLRPPRMWLVRYSPLLQDFALAAAGALPSGSTSPGRDVLRGASAAWLGAAPGAVATTPLGAPGGTFISGGGEALGAGGDASRKGGPGAAPRSSGSNGTASGRGARPYSFEGLDVNQMLDLAVALADLYVYPGDDWMRGHEARMVALSGLPAGAFSVASPAGGRGGSPNGGALTPFQLRLLQAAYAALDDTWEGYAAPRGGEVY